MRFSVRRQDSLQGWCAQKLRLRTGWKPVQELDDGAIASAWLIVDNLGVSKTEAGAADSNRRTLGVFQIELTCSPVFPVPIQPNITPGLSNWTVGQTRCREGDLYQRGAGMPSGCAVASRSIANSVLASVPVRRRNATRLLYRRVGERDGSSSKFALVGKRNLNRLR
jgi:hypothetical protein